MIDAVLGIDIGTGSVKVIAVSRQGKVIQTVSEHLKMIQPQAGYNEQRPDDWVSATIQCIKKYYKIRKWRMLRYMAYHYLVKCTVL